MLVLVLSALWLCASCAGQEELPANTVCSPEACYTAHLQRRSFNEAWRACRERGGNLASIKRQQEAELVEELMQGLPLSEEQGQLKLWLGLQRQPRQCSPYKSLRGFTWMTGDQDTWYTNWLKDEYPGSCPATRCVVLSFGAGEAARHANYKWLDGSCLLAVDGYLCRFSYRGMCERIELGARRPVVYHTPFGVTSSRLRHVPFGSVATLPCGGPRGTQSLLCMAREGERRRGGGGGGVGWSREPPYCQEARPRSWCAADNGGCAQSCVDQGPYYHCQCDQGYQLDQDGRSCSPLDGCTGGPCQFYCQSGPGGFTCSCPEGYQLDEDGHSCLDLDECSAAPCDQDCANTPGSYSCHCYQGYQLEEGECRDLDECVGTPCGQLCANTEGSFQCYCEVGFTLSEDAATCTDVDECHYQGSCQQMCMNYLGHYECHCMEGYALDPDGFSCHPHPPATPSGQGEERDVPQTQTPAWGSALPAHREGEREAPARASHPHATPRAPARPPARNPSPTAPAAEPRALETSRPQSSVPGERGGQLAAVTPPGWASTSRGMGDQQERKGGRPTAHPEEGDLGTSHAAQREEGDLGTSHAAQREEGLWKSRHMAMGRTTTARTSWRQAPTTRSRETAAPVWTVPRPGTTINADPDAHREFRQPRDDRWLLIALLVPVCVFLVVMLALAIVYCTRCACGKSANVTDCYHWINNSTKSTPPDTTSTTMNTTAWQPETSGNLPNVWRTDVTHL